MVSSPTFCFGMPLSASGSTTTVRRSAKTRAPRSVSMALLLRVRRDTLAEQKLRLFGPPVPLEQIAGRLRHLVKPGPVPTMREMRQQARVEFARRWRDKDARITAEFAAGIDDEGDGE
jgi:hypothetical protein